MQRAFACCLFILWATALASAQATYQLTFDSPWSAATHPGAYPAGAHFSPLIGGTHNGSVSYWAPGGIATPAIEQMAEVGGTTLLRNMVLDDKAAGAAAAVVQTSGLGAPGSVNTFFAVSPQHPLLTIVTMIAPSPDWFVGVSGLDLRANGQWVNSLTLDLVNYDAGTDAGANFTSPNMDITPHIPISVLDAPLEGHQPLASLTFTLTNATPLCDLDASGACDVADLDELLSVGPIASGVAVGYGVNNSYDLNGDEVIDLADRDEWLVGAAAENGHASPYSPADANLDGSVDRLDYVAWSEYKWTASLAASAGDFNGDGVVDGRDLLLWNGDKSTSSVTAAVPEPAAALMICWLWLALLRARK